MLEASLRSITSGFSGADETQITKFWNNIGNLFSQPSNEISQSIIRNEDRIKSVEITREYLTPYSTVLEIGCGMGETAIGHSPYVKNIHAIDVSSEMIESATEKAKEGQITNVRFEHKDIDHFFNDMLDNSVDTVLAFDFLHLVPNTDDFIQNVSKRLKPGGFFISTTPCDGGCLGRVAPSFRRFALSPKQNDVMKEELRETMENSGFEIEREVHSENGMNVLLVARKMK